MFIVVCMSGVVIFRGKCFSVVVLCLPSPVLCTCGRCICVFIFFLCRDLCFLQFILPLLLGSIRYHIHSDSVPIPHVFFLLGFLADRICRVIPISTAPCLA